jgi:hypothetical protein
MSLRAGCAFIGVAGIAPDHRLTVARRFRVALGADCCTIVTDSASRVVSNGDLARAACAELPASLQVAVTRLAAHYRLASGTIEILEDEEGRTYVAGIEPLPAWPDDEYVARLIAREQPFVPAERARSPRLGDTLGFALRLARYQVIRIARAIRSRIALSFARRRRTP